MSEHGAAPLFGVAAEFATEGQILQAATAVRARGFGRVDAFTPAPVPGLAEALGWGNRHLVAFGLAGAAAGMAAFFAMCLYATMVDYPFLIGGRPRFSWPYYVIPSTSFGMLCGALAVTLGMLFLNRLPQLNHPAFNIAEFERASRDRYFLTIEARDETFDPDAVEAFLRQMVPGPLGVQRVPR
jgi:hypothetical protein